MRTVATTMLAILAAAANATCPVFPPMPAKSVSEEAAVSAWRDVAAPYSVVHFTGGYDYAPFGVGRLKVDDASAHYYDWASKIVLPIWRQPRGVASAFGAQRHAVAVRYGARGAAVRRRHGRD